jgi:hypothetical protein
MDRVARPRPSLPSPRRGEGCGPTPGGWGALGNQAPEPPLQLHNNLRMIRNKCPGQIRYGRPRWCYAACAWPMPRSRGSMRLRRALSHRRPIATSPTTPASCSARIRMTGRRWCCASRRRPGCRFGKCAASATAGITAAVSCTGAATAVLCASRRRWNGMAFRFQVVCKPDHQAESLHLHKGLAIDDDRPRGAGEALSRYRVRAALGIPG